MIRWRTPKNNRGISDSIAEATGFLDGDLLETFLDIPHNSPQIIEVLRGNNEAERLNVPYAEFKQILEQLQTLH